MLTKKTTLLADSKEVRMADYRARIMLLTEKLSGLNILEPTGTEVDGTIVARVVKIASWRDASRTDMKRHDPEPTEVVVVFERDEPNSIH